MTKVNEELEAVKGNCEFLINYINDVQRNNGVRCAVWNILESKAKQISSASKRIEALSAKGED